MRIVRLMYFTQSYLRFRYEREPGLAQLPYEAQRRALFSDFYSFSDSWERALQGAGADGIDIPFGMPPLDDAFWRERGGVPDPRPGSLTTAIEVLKELKPDVVFLSSIETWSAKSIRRIRDEVPSLQGVLGMAGVDVVNSEALPEVDAFLTCMKGQASTLASRGLDARFMPHAFEPRLLEHVGPRAPDTPFAFFGNVFAGAQWHDSRRRILEALIRECDLVLYTSEQTPTTDLARKMAMTGAYWAAGALKHVPSAFERVPFGRELRKAATWSGPPSWDAGPGLAIKARPPVYGLEMYRELARTLLTVNVHIGAAGPYAANMRLFEATGVGTCLLTDSKSDLGEFFETGDEVVAFESVEDAVEKAKYLLANPVLAAEIGRKGQARTLRDHTYTQRAPTVLAAAERAWENGKRRTTRRAHSAPSASPSTLARPNLFVVGAMKSGTTSAFAYLNELPGVFTPRLKEAHHFSTDLHRHRHRLMFSTIHNLEDVKYVRQREEYEGLYGDADASTPYLVDASTSHLYSAEAAANIAQYSPGAKIVILLRDPALRAWSEYRMNQAIGLEFDSFRKALERERVELEAGRTLLFKRYLLAGNYAEQVERYLTRFNRDQVFIDVVDRPKEGLEPVLSRLTQFLGLPVPEQIRIHRENEAKAPLNRLINSSFYYSGLKAVVSQAAPRSLKEPAKSAYYRPLAVPMPAEDRAFAASFFGESNARLAALSKLDLSHWTPE